MPSDMARRRQARSARRLPLIFAATILMPGVILAGFGLHALTQERQNAERQARDTLNVVAENLRHRLELEFKVGYASSKGSDVEAAFGAAVTCGTRNVGSQHAKL